MNLLDAPIAHEGFATRIFTVRDQKKSPSTG